MEEKFSIEVMMEPETKAKADAVLASRRVTPSAIISRLYEIIAVQNTIPEYLYPVPKSIDLERMTKEDLDNKIIRSVQSAQEGHYMSVDELIDSLAGEFNIPREALLPRKNEP